MSNKLRALTFGLLIGSLTVISGGWNSAVGQELRERADSRLERPPVNGKPQLARDVQAPAKSQPEMFFCETSDASCRSDADSFSIDETRDLFVFITLPGVSGKHIETVEFVLPDGEIYQRKETLFQIGGGTSASVLNWNGHREGERGKQITTRPEAAHLIASANLQYESGIPSLLTESRGETTVVTILPIGGTYITQRALTGAWLVRIWIDSQSIAERTLNLYSNASQAKAEDEQAEQKEKGAKGGVRARSPKS